MSVSIGRFILYSVDILSLTQNVSSGYSGGHSPMRCPIHVRVVLKNSIPAMNAIRFAQMAATTGTACDAPADAASMTLAYGLRDVTVMF